MSKISSFFGAFKRDVRAGLKFGEGLVEWKKSELRNESLITKFRKTVAKNEDKIAIIFEDNCFTFKQLDEFSNRIANYFSSVGLKAGDEVALLMNNSHEYIGMWLGLIKVGIIPAFLNTNNRMDSLVDCFNALKCKAIIFDSHFTKALEDIYDKMSVSYPLIQYFEWTKDDNNNDINDSNNESTLPSVSFRNVLNQISKDSLDIDYKRNFTDTLLYIFTSGTTGGKPKAAIQTDGRAIISTMGFRITFRLKESDIIYNPFPLYHALGGISTVSICLILGITLVVAPKFSASEFWNDCIKNKCTVSVYIGEICRYLLAQPPKPEDCQHSLKTMFGIGLRKEYWNQFQTRFAIKHIYELYAASEANMVLFNIDNKEGSCGFYPWYWGPFLRILYPAFLIKVDPDTYEPVRSKKGFCKLAKPGDIGLIVGKSNFNDETKNFRGYTDPNETQKKIIHNVLSKGDKAFSSGDLLEIDFFGYVYFKDRTGDTFRWKGENVSTTDVEAILQSYLRLNDCIVFGIPVPQCEGKAGMAVICADSNEIDFKQLAEHLIKRLPSYAVPLFIRLANTSNLEMTSTYKLIKYKFKNIGFNPKTTDDLIYFFDRNDCNYIRLSEEIYEKIINGLIKL